MPARSAQPSPLADFANSSMVMKIIIITAIVYVADNFIFGNMVNEILGFDAAIFFKHWKVWQPITYLFTHAPMSQPGSGVMHILFNMYGLWVFGRVIEQRYGSREFLAFYLMSGAAAALIWSGAGVVMGSKTPGLIGASGAVSAVIILFALNFPRQQLRLMFPPITVPAWFLGIFIVGMDIRGAMGFGRDNIAFTVHLAGAAIAVLYFFSRMSLTGTRGRNLGQVTITKKQTKVVPHRSARHTCTVCNVTELDDRKMQFRYCSSCANTACYCENHIRDHEHIVQVSDAPNAPGS